MTEQTTTPQPPAREAAPAERTPMDLDRITLGEVATIEDLSGMSLDRFGQDGAPRGKFLAAMVYVQSRRWAEPMTWKECLDMPAPDASDYLGLSGDDEDDAQEADEDAEGQEDEDNPFRPS